MTKWIVIFWMITAGAVWLGAAEQTTTEPQKEAPPSTEPNLGEVKVEQPPKLEKALPPEEQWTQARYGVVGQFVQAPNALAPINPLAKAEAGAGTANLSRDTITGRIMGFRLISFNF
jgi:hypothetical protein